MAKSSLYFDANLTKTINTFLSVGTVSGRVLEDMFTSRNDALISKTESFTYDNLNRLTGANVSGGASHSLNYTSNGNISTKTDAGSYVYHASKINQVQQINPSAGNISNTSQAISTYTSFLQPSTVVEGVYNLTYTYADDEHRIKSVMKVNASTINTRYYFGEYEKDVTGTTTRYLHYVSNGERLIAIVERQGTTDTYHYTYTDHLGSINTITNSSGTVTYNLNFDAWGRRRNASNWTYTSISSPPSWLTRGFTGHEHMDYFALINMNGRLYDPILGRMLSLDNFVQAAGSTQGFNRYSYGLNNPLKYVDPDGELFGLFGKLIGATVNSIRGGREGLQQYIRNDLDIFGGLFATDENKTTLGRAFELTSRFIWQLPQTVVGYGFGDIQNMFGAVNNVTSRYGVTAIDSDWLNASAVTLGNYITGSRGFTANWRDHLFVHEYGHYVQSQIYGPIYLFGIGIPSGLDVLFDNLNHDNRWYESEASRMGGQYFDRFNGPNSLNAMNGDDVFILNNYYSGAGSVYPNPRRQGFFNTQGFSPIYFPREDDFIYAFMGFGFRGILLTLLKR